MPIHIGQKIKDLVERNNYNKTAFAEKMGMSENNLYKIFKKSDIDTELLRRISDELRVSITYFFEELAVPSNVNLHQSIGVNSGFALQHFNSVAECEKELEKAHLEITYLKRENELLRQFSSK